MFVLTSFHAFLKGKTLPLARSTVAVAHDISRSRSDILVGILAMQPHRNRRIQLPEKPNVEPGTMAIRGATFCQPSRKQRRTQRTELR